MYMAIRIDKNEKAQPLVNSNEDDNSWKTNFSRIFDNESGRPLVWKSFVEVPHIRHTRVNSVKKTKIFYSLKNYLLHIWHTHSLLLINLRLLVV